MPQKIDIPLDQAIALVRACQKLNCDTAEQLFDMVNERCGEIKTLREALEPFADIPLARDTDRNAPNRIEAVDMAITPKQVRVARSAMRHT
jgi:hypothetical protein